MLQIQDLPALNATLNATSAVLLMTAYGLIRFGRPIAHRNVMTAALVCSVLFLTSYLIYHAQVGSVPFPGHGAPRTVYLIILVTHTILAVTVPFLAGVTVVRAWRRRFPQHKRLARWTLPIWLYVSVTGVVVYWMLYKTAW